MPDNSEIDYTFPDIRCKLPENDDGSLDLEGNIRLSL